MSTTVAHGFSTTSIPVETFEKRKKFGIMFFLFNCYKRNVKTMFGYNCEIYAVGSSDLTSINFLDNSI